MILKKSLTFKLAFSGIIIAAYLVVLELMPGLSFRLIQVRMADALFGLVYLYPFLALPLAIANSVGNLFGGIGLPDVIGGFFAGLFTALGVLAVKRAHLNEWLTALPTVVVSAALVPVWLAPVLHVPYWLAAVSIGVGEIPAGIVGVLLMKGIRRAQGRLKAGK